MSLLNGSFNAVFYLEVKRSFAGSLQVILCRESVVEECSLNSTLLLHLNGENQIPFKLTLFLQLSI